MISINEVDSKVSEETIEKIPLRNEWRIACESGGLGYVNFLKPYIPIARDNLHAETYRCRPLSSWGGIAEIILHITITGQLYSLIVPNHGCLEEVKSLLENEGCLTQVIASPKRPFANHSIDYARSMLIINMNATEYAKSMDLLQAITNIQPADEPFKRIFQEFYNFHKGNELRSRAKQDIYTLFRKIRSGVPGYEPFLNKLTSRTIADYDVYGSLFYDEKYDATLPVETPELIACILTKKYELANMLLNDKPELIHQCAQDGRHVIKIALMMEDYIALDLLLSYVFKVEANSAALTCWLDEVYEDRQQAIAADSVRTRSHWMSFPRDSYPLDVAKEIQWEREIAKKRKKSRLDTTRQALITHYAKSISPRPRLHQLIVNRQAEQAMALGQEYLTSCQEKLNEKDAYGFTPLFLASYYGMTDMVTLLLENDIKPKDVKGIDGRYSLLAHAGNADILHQLLRHKTVSRSEAIFVAKHFIERNKVSQVNAVLNYWADIVSQCYEFERVYTSDFITPLELTILLISLSLVSLDMLRMLLSHCRGQYIGFPKKASKYYKEEIRQAVFKINIRIKRFLESIPPRPRITSINPQDNIIITHMYSDKHGDFYSYIMPAAYLLFKPYYRKQSREIFDELFDKRHHNSLVERNAYFEEHFPTNPNNRAALVQLIVHKEQCKRPIVASFFTFTIKPYEDPNGVTSLAFLPKLAAVRSQLETSESAKNSFRGLGFANHLMSMPLALKMLLPSTTISAHYKIIERPSFRTVPHQLQFFPAKVCVERQHIETVVELTGESLRADGNMEAKLSLKEIALPDDPTSLNLPARDRFFLTLTGAVEGVGLAIFWLVDLLDQQKAMRIMDCKDDYMPEANAEIYFSWLYHHQHIKYAHIKELASALLESKLILNALQEHISKDNNNQALPPIKFSLSSI